MRRLVLALLTAGAVAAGGIVAVAPAQAIQMPCFTDAGEWRCPGPTPTVTPTSNRTP